MAAWRAGAGRVRRRVGLGLLLSARGLHPLADAPPVQQEFADAWRIPLIERVLQAVAGREPPPAPALPAGRVTSGPGWRRDPLSGRRALHAGLDLGLPRGTLVRAPAPGLVLSAGVRGGYGRAVELALGRRCRVLLAHLETISVSPGDVVPRGWPLGRSGASGRATGAHLHFEHRCDAGRHAARRPGAHLVR